MPEQTSRPEIFVSATSADLRSCRQMIKEALLTLGCVPVEQTNFPPEASSVREMLRKKISACHAVIHVAGNVYGAEPTGREEGEPRRSYTQMEYEIARELGKPVYLFVCGNDFPYDEYDPEEEEKQRLQQEHRQRVQSGDDLFVPVDSRDDLSLKVHQLQTRVEELGRELGKSRSSLKKGLAIGIGLLLLILGLLWVVNQRTSETQQEVAAIRTELDQQRAYLKAVAAAYTEQQAKIADLKLTDEEKYERALASVANEEGIAPDELKSAINLFVAATRANPNADFLDQALADFAEKRFDLAAKKAGEAAEMARQEAAAAEMLEQAAHGRVQVARRKQRVALQLQGQSLMAEHRHFDAIPVYEEAISITDKERYPEEWVEIHSELANCFFFGPMIAGKFDIAMQAKAFPAIASALEILTADGAPEDWASLHTQAAGFSSGLYSFISDESPKTADILFNRALIHFASALDVYILEQHPYKRSETQMNLGRLHLLRIGQVDEELQLQSINGAIVAFKAALEGYSEVARLAEPTER